MPQFIRVDEKGKPVTKGFVRVNEAGAPVASDPNQAIKDRQANYVSGADDRRGWYEVLQDQLAKGVEATGITHPVESLKSLGKLVAPAVPGLSLLPGMRPSGNFKEDIQVPLGIAAAPVRAVAGLPSTVATVARGAGAYVAPNSVQAPSREEFEAATQNSTDLLMNAPLIAGGVAVAQNATAAARQSAASGLRASAQRSIKQVLNPTIRGDKVITDRIAPRLAESGPIAMTLKSYQSKVKGIKGEVGEALGEAHAQVPADKRVQTQGVIDAIEKSKIDNQAVIDGVVVEPEIVAAADKLKGIIEEFGPDVSYKSMVALRQRWDRTVAKAKGFVQQDLGAMADVKRDAVTAIREELAREAPSVAKLNAEYSFWTNADQVIGHTVTRKVGQAAPLGEQLATAAGAAGGLAGSGIGGAATAAVLTRGLTKIFRSTGWRTVSARVKSRLADAIASGDTAAIEQIGAEVAASTQQPVAAQPSTLARLQPQPAPVPTETTTVARRTPQGAGVAFQRSASQMQKFKDAATNAESRQGTESSRPSQAVARETAAAASEALQILRNEKALKGQSSGQGSTAASPSQPGYVVTSGPAKGMIYWGKEVSEGTGNTRYLYKTKGGEKITPFASRQQ